MRYVQLRHGRRSRYTAAFVRVLWSGPLSFRVFHPCSSAANEKNSLHTHTYTCIGSVNRFSRHGYPTYTAKPDNYIHPIRVPPSRSGVVRVLTHTHTPHVRIPPVRSGTVVVSRRVLLCESARPAIPVIVALPSKQPPSSRAFSPP